MEQLIVSLVMSLVQSIPTIIDAVNKSTNLTDEQKKKLLFDLNVHLTDATVKVAAVRFKDVKANGDAGKDNAAK